MREEEKLSVERARAAILANYGFAQGAVYVRCPQSLGALYAFVTPGARGFMFVAQATSDLEHTTAYLPNCKGSSWEAMDDGPGKTQRHGLFWIELAREYAALHCHVKRAKLQLELIQANPWSAARERPTPPCPWRVSRIYFSRPGGGSILVEFDDNVPKLAEYV